MTIAERILAAHSGRKRVEPGEFVNVSVDLAFAQERMTPLVVEAFRQLEMMCEINTRVYALADFFTSQE